jgi:hypothetical protein
MNLSAFEAKWTVRQNAFEALAAWCPKWDGESEPPFNMGVAEHEAHNAELEFDNALADLVSSTRDLPGPLLDLQFLIRVIRYANEASGNTDPMDRTPQFIARQAAIQKLMAALSPTDVLRAFKMSGYRGSWSPVFSLIHESEKAKASAS